MKKHCQSWLESCNFHRHSEAEGCGNPQKKFQNIAETDKIPYDDKTHKLFYNSSSFAKAENKEVREVLEFIYTLQANSDFTQSLETSAFNAKLSTSFKDEYMYFADILEEEKKKPAQQD